MADEFPDQPWLFETPRCAYCGGEDGPNHWLTCDGRQGKVEALADIVATFDKPRAREARDAALERVEAHAAPDFNSLARAAIERVARRRPAFIVDEVWKELGATAPTHEKRAMGAAMQAARREGVIEPTESFEASAQVQCHANPRRVWRSRVWSREAVPA